jgi:hypothetical protein
MFVRVREMTHSRIFHHVYPFCLRTVGLTASFFGLGATLSNFLGQLVVEKLGHVASLSGSFVISFIPLLLFLFMPETLGKRTQHHFKSQEYEVESYSPML